MDDVIDDDAVAAFVDELRDAAEAGDPLPSPSLAVEVEPCPFTPLLGGGETPPAAPLEEEHLVFSPADVVPPLFPAGPFPVPVGVPDALGPAVVPPLPHDGMLIDGVPKLPIVEFEEPCFSQFFGGTRMAPKSHCICQGPSRSRVATGSATDAAVSQEHGSHRGAKKETAPEQGRPFGYIAAWVLDAFCKEFKNKGEHFAYCPSLRRRVRAREEFKRLASDDVLLRTLMKAERPLGAGEPEEPNEYPR